MTALEETKKALDGVTPGPWELCAHLKHNDACSCGYRGVIYGPEPDGFAICQPGHEPAPEGQEGTEPPRYPRDVEIANMRYIAAVNPAAISELLSTLESLQRENEELLAENGELRNIVSNCAAALLTGAFVSPKCSVDFMKDVPKEIASTVGALRALASTGGEHHAE